MPNVRPIHPKAAAAGIGGAAGTLIIWVLALAGLQVSSEVCAAIVALAAYAASWAKPAH